MQLLVYVVIPSSSYNQPFNQGWNKPLLKWDMDIGIDTNIEVIVVSLTTRGLWWASQVVNETTMTEIEVSISILSWWNQINAE